MVNLIERTYEGWLKAGNPPFSEDLHAGKTDIVMKL